MLPLAVDRRKQLAGKAVTHALLIGVSKYDKLADLNTAAHTVQRVLEWILQADRDKKLVAPLATVTLLLSPSDEEVELTETILRQNLGKKSRRWSLSTGQNIRTARDSFQELIRDSENATRDGKKGLAIYYFAGHGADLFRGDPVGFARDADTSREPWSNAFDHLEFRERLTNRPRTDAGSTNCLFLYDCCRERLQELEGKPPDKVINFQYKAVTYKNREIRQWCVVKATTAAFMAWEPTEPIKVGPDYGHPLTYFGHAFLQVVRWATHFARHPKYTRCRSTLGIGEDIKRAISELASLDGIAEPLEQDPNYASGPKAFPIVYREKQPEIPVIVCCDPAGLSETVTSEIRRIDENDNWISQQTLDAPWPEHPKYCILSQGLYRISTAGDSGERLQVKEILRPVLTSWKFEIRHDEIKVLDPGN